jgi:lipoate-protein ligase A
VEFTPLQGGWGAKTDGGCKLMGNKFLFMFCISLESSDPFFNLAIEEVLLKNRMDDFLILGINGPSIVIGKHQSAHRESDTMFAEMNRIPVIRRISGGGTVFHDSGNLNFGFIIQSESGKQVDFRRYTRPVIDYLATIGIEARLEGKNDLKIDGLKISGNAEHVFRNRVLHHGTLLFSSSLSMLRNAIRKDTSHYSTRAVASNPSPVMNLSDKVKIFDDISQFRAGMWDYFLRSIPDAQPYILTVNDIEEATALASSKYRTWEWNYAYGPEYSFNTAFRFENSNILFSITVKEGIISECEIQGSGRLPSVAEKLIGCRHMPYDMLKLFYGAGIAIAKEDIYLFF